MRPVIFLLFISPYVTIRVPRSATVCQVDLAANLSQPRLQVFLTVNSLAKVFWNGRIEKRRLEINWVNPDDRQAGDFIGLYNDDPHWYQVEPVVRVPASYPGQYYLTSIEFPDIQILHHALLQSELRTMCLYNYWVAYVRDGMVLDLNCIKIQPNWMMDMADEIGSVPLHSLMIPGTHNSGSYNKFDTFGDDTVLMRYSVNQGEDVWTQLMFGIRYLDLRVSYFEDTPEKFWLVHDFVKMNPLYEAIHAVKRFLRITREMIILDFHRFPTGFSGDFGIVRHAELVDYINSELGEFLAPDWLGRGATLNDLWHLNRTLVITYQDDLTETQEDNLWSETLHAWGNTKEPAMLFRFLAQTMRQKRRASYLWVAMTHLTPSPMDIIWNLTGGIRKMNDRIARSLTRWYRDNWWDEANIVATDFFLSNNLVDVARQANGRRTICRDET